MDFSVLMSVYMKEKPQYLKQAIDSVLNSSLQPTEILIIEDGKLTKELYDVLESYPVLRRIKFSKNMGLGKALDIGVEEAKTNLIARMDTDDICKTDRFELQIEKFVKNKDLVLVGSDIAEFDQDYTKINQIKKMPEYGRDIMKYAELRNPFNHPTVMFRKDAIQKVGSYKAMPYFEDYYLWLRIIKRYPEKSYENISEPLVLMRTDENLYKRRGGLKYIKHIIYFRKTCVKENLLNVHKAIYSSVASVVVSIFPNNLRKKIYVRILRK